MNGILQSHLAATIKLFELLKTYIECKNYGIHGFFIKTANKTLNDLMVEIFYLQCIEKYLNNSPYELKGQMKEVPVSLQFKTLSEGLVKEIRDKAYDQYLTYAQFPQSCCVKNVKYVLETLEKDA
jgi:hypothetical protein